MHSDWLLQNVIYNVYAIAFQKEFGTCKEIMEFHKEKWQVDYINYYTPHQSEVLF